MRILINGLFLIPNRVGGSETYLRGLVRSLAAIDGENEYIICLGPEAAPTFRLTNRWRILTSPGPSTQRAVRIALEQVWLPRVANAIGVDVIHSAGYTSPLVSRAARITSIHDMNYRRHPEDMSALERLVYSVLVPLAARRSHRVFALTYAARADIMRWTGIGESKIDVIHLGHRGAWPGDPAADEQRVLAAGVVQPFLLGVAASYPHKNTYRLIQAFPIVSSTSISVGLVMVGHAGRAQRAIEAAAAAKAGIVQLLGWVDDALLASLYRRSVGLAFPSLYEGFGLPIVEAMALGTPVLTSSYGAMMEVANGAAELVDPYDVGAIKIGLQRLVDDSTRREELRQLGRRRAAEFSWERTAAATLAAYRTAAQQVVEPRPTNSSN
jgi:glycosyltransferase involved in cell wall biosynthesis